MTPQEKKKIEYSGPIDTLIWDLYHWIPLFVLIVMVPIIFKPNCFMDPTPLPKNLIWDLSHCIPQFVLIVMVPIMFKPIFFMDLTPLPDTLISHLS